MSQNREAQKDRIKADYDHKVNVKSLKGIADIQKRLNALEKKITKKR